MAADKVLIYAMGDRVCRRDDYKEQFAPIRPFLLEADIRYCQLEQIFSERGEPCVYGPKHYRTPLKYLDALTDIGINATSPNGNHGLEWGHDAFLDTIDNLEKKGIKTFGVGKNIEEARKPAIFDIKGNKIAFLAYNSIIQPREEAGENWPGVAPMRVHTYYEAAEPFQPGNPALVHTFPYPEDVAAMQKDIEKAKRLADVVVVALHFGLHFRRAVLADYQPVVAHAAIDAGADVIIGAHPHVLKAIEVYKGKVIFYSLGNFAFDPPIHPVTKKPELPKIPANVVTFVSLFGLSGDPEYPYNEFFGHDALKTGLAKIVVSDKKIVRVSFVPALLNKDEQPIKCSPGSKDFDEVIHYVKDVTKEVGIETKFKVEGDELVVVT